jgi:hypothetical protein
MASTALRNVVVMVLAAAAYTLFLRYGGLAMDSVGAGGRVRLLMLLAFHILFGVIGTLFFRGAGQLRAGMVFLSVITVGLGLELYEPDPRHRLVQLFVAVAFGAIAAVASLVFSAAKSKPAVQPNR